MIQIISKFDGICKGCGKKIQRGSTIIWSKKKGAFHLECAPSHKQQKDKNEISLFSSENILVRILEGIIVFMPLAFGPTWMLTNKEIASTWCLGLPLFAAVLIGLKPISGTVRVKWGRRRAYKADMYFYVSWGMAAASAIPALLLWIIRKIFEAPT